MGDSVKKWHELNVEGWWTQDPDHPNIPKLILNADIARDEWEAYYKENGDVLENSEDFEVAYGFVTWIFNRNYKILK